MKAVLVLLLLLVLVALGDVALPVASLLKLRAAIESGDTAALSEVVDFEALRGNLQRRAQQRIAQRTEDRPLGGVRARVAEALVSFKLEDVASPEGLIAAICRDSPPNPEGGGCRLDGELQGLSFDGMSRASAQVLLASGHTVRLMLQRQGLGWPLVDLESPKLGEQAQWRLPSRSTAMPQAQPAE